MDQQPTSDTGDASPIDRIAAMLGGDEPQDETEVQETEQAAEAPEEAVEPPKEGVEQQEGETPEYQLSDVAKLLGADESALDVDDDGSVMVKVKIDGVEGKAKFADLLKNYQLKGHAENTVREAAEIRKQAIEQAQAAQQQIQVQQQIVGKIAEIKAVEQEFQQYRAINLDALIDQDPVQALKVQRHMQALQERHAALTNEANQAANYVQQQQVHVTQATLHQEAQALMQALPEWADGAKAETEKKAIKADLKARGYSDRDIEALSDHKAVLLARDAMLYRQMQSAGKSVEKQIRNAPKIVRPGTTQSRGTQSTVSKIKAEVRNGGGKSAFENYLLATGKL
jgi:hypothetical protein